MGCFALTRERLRCAGWTRGSLPWRCTATSRTCPGDVALWPNLTGGETVDLLVNIGITVLSGAAFVAAGLGARGATVAEAALGITGFAFLGVALLVNQLTATSRAANSLAGVAAGLGYLLRAIGDALGWADLTRLRVRSAWPSWLSPIGWGEQTFAFTDNRLWPLVPGVALGAATAGAAVRLQSGRDLGESWFAQTQGPSGASKRLRSHRALQWRLQRPAVVGWAVAGAGMGLLTGSLSTAVSNATLDNPQIAKMLASLASSGRADTVGLIISAILGLVVVMAAAAGVQGVLRLRSDETNGAAELVLAAPVSRLTWMTDGLIVGTAAVVVTLAGAALGAALGFLATGDRQHAGVAAAQALAGAPAAWVLVCLSAAAVVLGPRLAVAFTWGLFAVALVLGLLGGLLNLPHPLRQLSPFSHLPSAPVDHWPSQLVLLVIAVALAGVAALALRRRDLCP